MELTEAELEEGRYLLEKYGDSQDSWTPLDQWMWEHRRSLLARREEIAREAVREFAGEIVAHLESSIPCQDGTLASADFWDGKRTAFATVIRRLHGEAAARGATLDEKP